MAAKVQKTVKKSRKKKTVRQPAKRLKQKAFIDAFISGRYHIGEACSAVGISRSCFADWRLNDSQFQQNFSDAIESQLDGWEKALHKNILSGDTASIIFALKTKGKERGYVERENNNKKVAEYLEAVLADKMTAREAAFKISAMGLPLPRVLEIELSKGKDQGGEDPGDFTPISEEELEKRASDRLAAIEQQRDEFLPQRRAEVAEIKERLKDMDSFAPEMFEGE